MMSSQDAFAKDACPVEDELLGTLYRASPHGLAELVRTVPAETRAMLALFCYRRSHMQGLALTIAASCERRDLVEWGGALGSAIYEQALQSQRKTAAVEPNSRRKVTLSTAPLGSFAPLEDDLDDDVVGDAREAGAVSA
ncbi:MAG: hypothetical protein R3D69_03460 [Xanthobacteraceae bacterium]